MSQHVLTAWKNSRHPLPTKVSIISPTTLTYSVHFPAAYALQFTQQINNTKKTNKNKIIKSNMEFKNTQMNKSSNSSRFVYLYTHITTQLYSVIWHFLCWDSVCAFLLMLSCYRQLRNGWDGWGPSGDVFLFHWNISVYMRLWKVTLVKYWKSKHPLHAKPMNWQWTDSSRWLRSLCQSIGISPFEGK